MRNKWVLKVPRNQSDFFSTSLFVVMLNFIIAISCLIHILDSEFEYKVVVLLPALYSMLFCLTRQKFDFSRPGIFMLNCVAFVRYALMPFVILYTETLSQMARSYEYVEEAILMMLIEMITIYAVAVFYNPEKKTLITGEIAPNFMIKTVAVGLFIVLFLNNRVLIGNLSILGGELSYGTETAQISGMVGILWQAICAFIFAYIVFDLYRKETKKGLWISMGISLGYVVILFTGQTVLTRWYAVVTIVAAVFWLINLYPKKKIAIFACILLPCGVLILAATIIKNTLDGFDSGFIESMLEVFSSTNLDCYFAGPVNINNSIGANSSLGIDISSMFYDALNNFPYLGNFIDRSEASVSIYNAYLGRGDQVLPLVGQSFGWFGVIGIPVLPIISTLLVKKMDSLFQMSKSIMTYLYAFLAVWCALMPALNMTIWVSWMYSKVIPAYLLFKLATKKV